MAELGDHLVYGVCQAIEGEKDPHCLMLIFRIVKAVQAVVPAIDVMYQALRSPYELKEESVKLQMLWRMEKYVVNTPKAVRVSTGRFVLELPAGNPGYRASHRALSIQPRSLRSLRLSWPRSLRLSQRGVNCRNPQVHFWAPTFKWGIGIANVADFSKPLKKLSYPQQLEAPCL
ncbi:hypothetical protein Droror1_Dr00012214 [Drosera rotundifolia]